MAELPEIAVEGWENHEGPFVLTTVDPGGMPNTIYVTCVKKIAGDKIAVADNKMNKTRANIKAGSPASLLYITKAKKAFQVKGSVSYLTEGEIYDDMKNGWLDKKYPGHAVVVIHVKEVYSGAEKLA
jgi:predicted pyridoxine 5'-phosphate oxidase superfamily flavin-nucleotide-binding protein